MTADDAEQKADRAFDLLRDGELEQALGLGRELATAHHVAGYEIQALAQQALGRSKAAIQVLERGLRRCTSAWPLWQLLGNLYSESELYDEAIAAYERALGCADVDTLCVHFNLAMAMARQDRLEAALSHLELAHIRVGPDHRQLRLLGASQRIAVLARLGRHAEAVREGQRIVARARIEGTLDEHVAPVLAELAHALWTGAGDREAAERTAWEAIGLDKTAQAAICVIRELNGRASPAAAVYRVLLAGHWPEAPFEDEPSGFYTEYDVIADSPEEALEFARPFEPEPVRTSLRVEDWERLEACPDEPKGVCMASGYRFFDSGS